jgi:hypothetical protein
MRKTTAIASAILVGIIASVGVIVSVRAADAIGINKADYPAEGVRLIVATDAEFPALFSAVTTDLTASQKAAVAPFCAFVRNDARLPIVSLRLRFEAIRTNGTKKTYDSTYAAPRLLMDGGNAGEEALALEGAIAPGTTRFLTVVPFVDISMPTAVMANQPVENFDDPAVQSQVKQASIDAMRSGVTSVTISVDGLFFTDGGYLGQDKSSFFDETKAQLDAYSDLCKAIGKAQLEGRTPTAIIDALVAYVENYAPTEPGPGGSLTEFYQSRFRKAVDTIVEVRDKLGAEAALDYATAPTRRTWVTLYRM